MTSQNNKIIHYHLRSKTSSVVPKWVICSEQLKYLINEVCIFIGIFTPFPLRNLFNTIVTQKYFLTKIETYYSFFKLLAHDVWNYGMKLYTHTHTTCKTSDISSKGKCFHTCCRYYDCGIYLNDSIF